ncbi:hypothetical protein CP083_02710 [Candidatus Bathyarchaeota archaeon B24-2]|nr:MAG: hypothetical protein CP083_02710 [Candidatus Bathyarchaeota archaeon B24-2]
MENISVFLDTDVLINWLAKEVDPNTGEELWRAPLRILKEIEVGELSGFTSIINLMEIIFVLRRKKRWKDEKIISTIGRIREIPNFSVLIPTEADMISAYSIQTVFALDPFNSIYYSMSRKRIDYIISRDSDFISIVNSTEKKLVAFTPEKFLKDVMKKS